MTIDEAIVQIKEIAKEKRNEIYTFGMHCNPKITKDLEMYEQFAEWLEELKERQQSNFDYVQLMDVRYKAGYTKAIEDFAEALKKRYPIMENGLFTINDVLQKEIDRIAEQLKEGSADNE